MKKGNLIKFYLLLITKFYLLLITKFYLLLITKLSSSQISATINTFAASYSSIFKDFVNVPTASSILILLAIMGRAS